MTLTRFAKANVYAVAVAILITVSATLSIRLHDPSLMEKTYFHTNLYWFIVSVCLLGGGVFCWREYARNDREHRPDVLFTVITGAVLLVVWIVMLLQYGGLVEGQFSENAYTAVNVNILVMWAMPIPLLVRLLVLAMSSRIESVKQRRALQLVTLVLIIVFAVTTAVGGTVNMVRYTEPETTLTQTEV